MTEPKFTAHSSGAMREKMTHPTYDQMPLCAIEGYGRVANYGEVKYAAWNWAKGLPQRQIMGSLMRHLFAYMQGEERDVGLKGSGLPHVDHIVWNAVALHFNWTHGIEDDRRKIPIEVRNRMRSDHVKDVDFTSVMERAFKMNEAKKAEAVSPGEPDHFRDTHISDLPRGDMVNDISEDGDEIDEALALAKDDILKALENLDVEGLSEPEAKAKIETIFKEAGFEEVHVEHVQRREPPKRHPQVNGGLTMEEALAGSLAEVIIDKGIEDLAEEATKEMLDRSAEAVLARIFRQIPKSGLNCGALFDLMINQYADMNEVNIRSAEDLAYALVRVIRRVDDGELEGAYHPYFHMARSLRDYLIKTYPKIA